MILACAAHKQRWYPHAKSEENTKYLTKANSDQTIQNEPLVHIHKKTEPKAMCQPIGPAIGPALVRTTKGADEQVKIGGLKQKCQASKEVECAECEGTAHEEIGAGLPLVAGGSNPAANPVANRHDGLIFPGVVEGGCSITPDCGIEQPIEQPLNNLEKWLTSDALEVFAGVSQQAISKAMTSRKWRGSDLVVRMVEVGRGGAGGKAPQVHVDSLPSDLREAWYLERDVVLHQKTEGATGQTILVPDCVHDTDARFDADLAVARWRHDLIKAALSAPKMSKKRALILKELSKSKPRHPNGKQRKICLNTLYSWVRDYEAEGLNGLMRKRRADIGEKRQMVTRAWDAVFAGQIGADSQAQVNEELTKYIRSLWASGERGWRAVTEKSTTRLIEITSDLGVAEFDTLDVGRSGDLSGMQAKFGICAVPRRKVDAERAYRIIALKDKDNTHYQDKYMPSIRRDYSTVLPREIVVGDVHPVDVMIRRADGTVAYPKAIAWYDVATNEMHMTFVLLEPGEGIRREHVAQSFQAMVEEWGLPKMLYLDNGGEYSWDQMIGGFTQLSKLTGGSMGVKDLSGDPNVAERVTNDREALVRSRLYNAKGKSGIEGAFGNIEQVFFATIPGWTSGDRMSKKTHAKGKDPIAFKGDHMTSSRSPVRPLSGITSAPSMAV